MSNIFNERVRQVINENNLTLSSVAETAQISISTVNKWINPYAVVNAKMNSVISFALAFNVSVDWLFGLTDER